ncbi:hypothetical protein RN001_014880 [Aquatica leii]|uniref:Luciferin 4-monooxygenase n=1 Tax=Aquatica leii TaxID=1421715 RepID=A0AAN7S6E7_9COLE|nr:hypothetical protein RN001_014880 [Aquatica leii]
MKDHSFILSSTEFTVRKFLSNIAEVFDTSSFENVELAILPMEVRSDSKTLVKLTYNDGIITTPDDRDYKPDPRGVGYALFTNLKKNATKRLQIDASTGEEDTYGSVLQRSIRIAMKLLEFGLTPNDIVATCMANHTNSCVTLFASLFVGVKLVCFDYRMEDKETAILMKQIEPKIIFVDLESISFIESTLKLSEKTATIIVFGKTPNYLNFFDFLLPIFGEDDFKPVEVDKSQTAFIFFTSGSTGLPKGVCLSHDAFLGQVGVVLDLNEPYERVVETSTSYWELSIFYWFVLVVRGGYKILVPYPDDVELIWKSISNYNATYMLTTPFELREMWKSKPADVCGDSVTRIDIVGGTTPECELIRYRKFFSNAIVTNAYGTTETGMIICFQTNTEKDFEFLNKKIRSIGSVLNGISYKIVDVDTKKVLGPNQEGELVVKTKNVLTEYYKFGTMDAFDSEGWFRTGDIMYYDEDYYFYFVERLKEMMKYRAWHISPKMIENVLLSRDDISAACVIEVPHDEDDQRIMAIVELSNSNIPVDVLEHDICQSVETVLGNKFIPREGIKIVDRIPRTPTGKYDIRKLKSMFKKSEIK